jgi:hypothetical protein
MRSALIVLALASVLPASAAHAHESDWCGIDAHCSPPVYCASRVDTHDARIAITTQDGNATLFLTNSRLGVQLSDRKLRDIHRQFREEEDADYDNAFAKAIKTIVYSSVRMVLDHSLECRIRDIRDVQYQDGSLVLTSEDGDTIFEHVDVHDESVLNDFSERDARAFVREFHRLKDRSR